MERLIAELIWIALAYLIGSIPWGVVIAKMASGIDPREMGSKSTGATNVARICGTGYGVATFLLDMLKGLLPVLIGAKISSSPLFLSLTALAALLGHIYSVFLDLKGGKGVATTIGIFLAIIPGATLVGIAITLLVIWLTGYVSLGSITLMLLLPILILTKASFTYFVFALVVMLLVINRHRENIVRVIKGEENPWQRKKFQKEMGQSPS